RDRVPRLGLPAHAARKRLAAPGRARGVRRRVRRALRPPRAVSSRADAADAGVAGNARGGRQPDRLRSAAAPRAPGRVNPMPTRRHFVESLVAAGAAVPALTNNGLDRLRGLARRVTGRAPADVARDEDFWFEIQQAFTLDRTLINLNNGGVSPSPRVVQEAMKRYLHLSNEAPVHTMWRLLEPQIESVRRRLATSFGCDPEEMAITRNASEALETCILGLDLKPGDEVLTTNQDYPRMLTSWRQREKRDGLKIKTISFPVPPPSIYDLYDRFDHSITPKTKVILFFNITNLN